MGKAARKEKNGDEPAPPPTWRRHLFPALVFVIAASAYLPSLDNQPVYDDVQIVVRDRRVQDGKVGAFWSGDYWPGSRPSYNYRPLTSSTFALAALAGLDQRAINLALHGFCAVFVLLILGRLGLGRWPAAAGAVLFGLHPLSSEALYLIVGRAELLAALFSFALIYCVLRRAPLILASLLYAAAIFSKSNAVVVPALALLLYRYAHADESWRDLARFAVKLALYTIAPLALLFLARWLVFGMLLTPKGYVQPLYNPLADLPFATRALNALWMQLRYLVTFAWPISLSADYSCCQLALAETWFGLRGAAVFFAFSGFGALAVWRRTRGSLELAGLAFVLLALLPVSNLLFVIGVMFGERLAYLPALGFALLAAALVSRARDLLESRGRLWATAPLVLAGTLAVVFAVTTIRRDADWQDERAFCNAVVRDAPRSALAYGLRFVWHDKRGDKTAAKRDLRAAVAIYPRYHDAWISLAMLLARAGDRDSRLRAVEAYLRAAKIVATRPRDRREAGFLYGKAALLQARLGQCKAARQSVAAARAFVEARHKMYSDIALWLRSCAP